MQAQSEQLVGMAIGRANYITGWHCDTVFCSDPSANIFLHLHQVQID